MTKWIYNNTLFLNQSDLWNNYTSKLYFLNLKVTYIETCRRAHKYTSFLIQVEITKSKSIFCDCESGATRRILLGVCVTHKIYGRWIEL